MFGLHRKKEETLKFDPAKERPVIRVSICTGEKTGCLQDLHTKKLTDVCLIRDRKDLEAFGRMTGKNPEEIEEIW